MNVVTACGFDLDRGSRMGASNKIFRISLIMIIRTPDKKKVESSNIVLYVYRFEVLLHIITKIVQLCA